MSRFLLTLGLVLILASLLWPYIEKLGWGKFPGDIILQKENFTFYFPITTSIIVSIFATVLFWFFKK